MTKNIKIKDFCSTALSLSNAQIIKEEIDKYINDYDQIVLDFEGIELFATPFFNMAIGHFVTRLTPEIFENKISCINLSELGRETYSYSFKNACSIYEKSLENEKIDEINAIINNNIEDS